MVRDTACRCPRTQGTGRWEPRKRRRIKRLQRATAAVVLIALVLGSSAPTLGGRSRDKSGHHNPIRFPNQIAIDDSALGGSSAQEFATKRGCASSICTEQWKVVISPFGCNGTSDNPHKSRRGEKRNKLEITAKSHTICGINVPSLMVSNRIYRDHIVFWGPEGRPGSDAKSSARSVTAVAVAPCNNDNYLNYAYHELTGPDRQLYWKWSDREAAVQC